jgi:osmotically-inducible protein OsmY
MKLNTLLAIGAIALTASPVFAAGDDADNSKQNAGDGSELELTPIDQSNDPADIKITAETRKAAIAEDGFSMNAKNAKIITVDGVVTLRGVVDSAEEKARLEVLAQDAGATSVQNQLTINTNE